MIKHLNLQANIYTCPGLCGEQNHRMLRCNKPAIVFELHLHRT